MLADFVKSIVALAATGSEVRVQRCSDLPRKVILTQGGQRELLEAEAPLRRPSLRSLDDLVQMAAKPAFAPNPEVYHCHGEVELLLDGTDRLERAVVPLQLTDRFSTLVELQRGMSLGPAQAVRFLRQSLPDTNSEHVVSALRRVDFTRTSSGKSDVAHGRESLGRAIEAQVQQADQIPEHFDVQVPVYHEGSQWSVLVAIRVGVYLNLEKQTIDLQTQPDQIEAAIQVAQRSIGNRLRELLPEVPVFHGSTTVEADSE